MKAEYIFLITICSISLTLGIIVEIRLMRMLARTAFKIRKELVYYKEPNTDWIMYALHRNNCAYAEYLRKYYNRKFKSDLFKDLAPKLDAIDKRLLCQLFKEPCN